MSTEIDMVWVAEDHNQPGAAFAICASGPEYRKLEAECVAEWITAGNCTPKLVTREVGIEMVDRWVRPKKSAPIDRERDDFTQDMFAGQEGGA